MANKTQPVANLHKTRNLLSLSVTTYSVYICPKSSNYIYVLVHQLFPNKATDKQAREIEEKRKEKQKQT